jgi:hypothetical protein
MECARKFLESFDDSLSPIDLIFEAAWKHVHYGVYDHGRCIVPEEELIRMLKAVSAYDLDYILRDRQSNREAEERYRRRRQGLCQHCGGKFKGFWTLKCRDCGKEKDYTD